MSRSRKIGVFVSHIFGEYQRELCRGIIDRTEEYGYVVDIFASNDGENLRGFDTGEESILNIPCYEDYQAIILASDTYRNPEVQKKILDRIKEQCHCPILDLSAHNTAFFNIVIENHTPVEELVRHLITVHHYRNIAYLGFRPDINYSTERFHSYQKVLKEYELPFMEEQLMVDTHRPPAMDVIVDLLFPETVDAARATDNAGAVVPDTVDAARTTDNAGAVVPDASNSADTLDFAETGGFSRPEAIVCYNDRIAINLAGALKARGIRIPEDVAITGYDDLEYAKDCTPPLTTVRLPVYEVGIATVEKLLKAIAGEKQDRVSILPAHPAIRSSCGCQNSMPVDPNYNLHLIHRVENRELHIMEDMNMSASLTTITNLDDGMDALEPFTRSISNLEELYLCLYPNWDSLSRSVRSLTGHEPEDPDNRATLLKFGLRDGKRVQECRFLKETLLPEYVYNDAAAYVYSPLYFRSKAFGYVACTYKRNEGFYDFNFISWMMNVSNMLQRIRDNKERGLLVETLTDLYMKDDLTGLYTRKGFSLQSNARMETAFREQVPLTVISLDLDGLKVINDTFGHEEGDFALLVLAKAIEHARKPEDLCARIGGDEFILLSCAYQEPEMYRFINSVQEYLHNYNLLYSKPYRVSASIGGHVAVPCSMADLDIFMREADTRMYKDKCQEEKQCNKREYILGGRPSL